MLVLAWYLLGVSERAYGRVDADQSGISSFNCWVTSLLF